MWVKPGPPAGVVSPRDGPVVLWGGGCWEPAPPFGTIGAPDPTGAGSRLRGEPDERRIIRGPGSLRGGVAFIVGQGRCSDPPRVAPPHRGVQLEPVPYHLETDGGRKPNFLGGQLVQASTLTTMTTSRIVEAHSPVSWSANAATNASKSATFVGVGQLLDEPFTFGDVPFPFDGLVVVLVGERHRDVLPAHRAVGGGPRSVLGDVSGRWRPPVGRWRPRGSGRADFLRGVRPASPWGVRRAGTTKTPGVGPRIVPVRSNHPAGWSRRDHGLPYGPRLPRNRTDGPGR